MTPYRCVCGRPTIDADFCSAACFATAYFGRFPDAHTSPTPA